MTPYSGLVGVNDANKVIYNKFVSHDQLLKIHRFLTRKSSTENDFFYEMAEFCQLQRLLE